MTTFGNEYWNVALSIVIRHIRDNEEDARALQASTMSDHIISEAKNNLINHFYYDE